jgi:hypothetical protein
MSSELEQEMVRQRHNKSHHHSQSHFLRNFPRFNMAHMARTAIKPITSAINHAGPLIALLGGHKGQVIHAVSGIVDKLV